MNELGLEGSFWPGERQKLLLRTATAGGEASAEAWRQLRPQLDLERLELGSFPVLPLVHRQLERLGIEDPYLPRLAGIRRRTWALNRLGLDALAPALRALEDAGAEPVVVGGWQFPARYYGGDFGLRQVDGLEVLVRPGFAALHDAGTTGILHQRFARDFSGPEREIEDLWERTVELTLGETRARMLAPTDELVRVCLAGARASEPPNVLWVADAIAVLQASGPSIDWERVVRHSLRLRAMLRLHDALVYLRRELDAAVPDEAIRELEAHPPLRREALAHRKAGRSPRVVATRFLHLTADRSLPAAMVALPTFLRDELGLKRRAQVPLEVVRRAAIRMRVARPTVEAR